MVGGDPARPLREDTVNQMVWLDNRMDAQVRGDVEDSGLPLSSFKTSFGAKDIRGSWLVRERPCYTGLPKKIACESIVV